MTRIFVRNIPAQASKEDLEALFAKISPVSEVYVPPPTITTLRRNFAIVCIEGDDNEGKKCVKALNNSVWKGEKLSIEMANEYHKDRLAREKEDEIDRLYTLQKFAQDALIVEPLPPVTKEVISLRRNRAQELPTAISMNPSVGSRPDKPKKNAKKVIVPCGVKLIFDEDLLVSGRVNYAEESSDSETEADNKGKTSADGKTSSEGLGSDMAKIVTKLNSGEVKPIGGGMRRGFGAMSLPTAPEVRVAAPVQKVVDFAPKSHLPTHKVDCCIDEHDLHAPSHLLDEDEQSVEEEPCLTEADLTQEVLAGDRNRALDIFNSLPIGPDGLVIPLNKKKLARDAAKEAKKPTPAIETPQNEAGDVASVKKDEAPSVLKTDKSTKPVEEEKKKDKKVNKVEFAEDEDIFMFESDIKIDAPVAVSKVQKETNDILKEMKAQQQKDQQVPETSKPAAVIADVSKSSNSGNDSEKASKKEDATAAASGSVSAEEEEDILKTKDGFANMNVLKNIFYKEGGVWWGDDGTLSGAVGKGSAALDPLFLEAEKHGIDIRTAQKMHSGSDNMEVEEVVEEKQMLFGFFGGDDSAAAEVPVNPFLSKPTSDVNSAMAGIFGGSSASAGVTGGETGSVLEKEMEKLHQARVSTMVETEAATSTGSVVKSRPVEVTIDAAQMVALAKKFAREKSVEVLTTEWREGRDRLVLDYKRKRKDMKRRTAAWSNSNPLTASSSAADKAEKTPSNGGGGSSVAGSSRGPQYMRGQRGGVGRKRARKG